MIVNNRTFVVCCRLILWINSFETVDNCLIGVREAVGMDGINIVRLCGREMDKVHYLHLTG